MLTVGAVHRAARPTPTTTVAVDHHRPRGRDPGRDRDDRRPVARSRVGTRTTVATTLPWRATRDRWLVLVSEVMLHQTQAPRVAQVYDAFVAQFPTPAATAAASPAAVIAAWGRLGYPRRARWLWDAARRIDADGWPDDLRELPGVGRYTAAAVAAQADDADAIGIEVNIRRVCERVRGERLLARRSRSAPRSRSPRRCADATGCSR